MKRKAMALTLLLAALLLAGCAKKPAEQPDAAPLPQPQTAAAAAETEPEVENNGGFYVRVGDTVYFRRYGADALPKNATYGAFTSGWSVRGESELMAYDTKTGALSALYREAGAGELWYGDGGFYLCQYADDEPFVAWYALDGSGVETIGPGRLLGVTDSGLVAAVHYDAAEGFRTVYTFYRDKKAVGSCSPEEYMGEAGLTDDGLFLLSTSYDAAAPTFAVWQITPAGEQLCLGEITESEEAAFLDIEADRFLAADGSVTIGIGYYAGTGHFLDHAAFVRAEIGRADSLAFVETEVETDQYEELPYPVRGEAGGVDYVEALPDALRVAWDKDNALEVYVDGAWQTLAEHFTQDRADGWAKSTSVQHMDFVDGAAYATVACQCASPAYDIGWRLGETLVSMRYLRVARDGTVTELDCVDCGAELFGYVWFIEGEGIALWEQLNSEDGEGWFEVNYAYALPIAPDAYWDDAAFDGTTGLLPFDYGEGEADYFGYPVPDAAPAGELSLVLDRDGTVTALLRRDPAAVMNIDFDVPPEALSGAAATLALERRESDEDTPWYWAALRVLSDGVHVRLERTPDDPTNLEWNAMIDGSFVPGEVVYDGTLNRGEFLAVRVSLPWHPELRVSAAKDGAWGSYVFGEDNYLHLESENGVHPGLTLSAYPSVSVNDYTGESLMQALCGAWLHHGADGAADAELTIDSEGNMTLARGEEMDAFSMAATPGRLYAGEWDTPDLLCLTTEDDAVAQALGFGGSVGDYGVELFRTEGEEILRLTQRNNGDGALGALLPDENGNWTYDYVFTRSCGAAEAAARRLGITFPAEIVRCDADSGVCWLSGIEIAESDESIGTVWRAKGDAPCVAYGVTKDVAAALNGTHPMLYRAVTTDLDGTITAVEALED